MTRLSRLKLSARLCNLGLYPKAAFNTQTLGANVQFGSKSGCSPTLARLISTLFRSYVQTFPTRTLGANLQFGSKSGCGATLGGFLSRLFRPYDKTFRVETLGATLQFGFKSGSGATLGASFVQNFQTL